MSEEIRNSLVELTGWEIKTLVPMFLYSFNTRENGKQFAVTSTVICERMNKLFKKDGVDYKITDSKVRQVIHYIRQKGLMTEFLVAGSKGYWKESDRERVEEYLSSLRKRVREIQDIVDAGEAWKREQLAVSNEHLTIRAEKEQAAPEKDLFGAEVHTAVKADYKKSSEVDAIREGVRDGQIV